MELTVLEKIPEDAETILAWNNLVFQMESPEVFYTQQWALAASHAFLDSVCPLVFLFHESSELRGVAALAIGRQRPNQAFFLTASTADYCDIVSAPDDREACLTAIFSELGRRKIPDLVLANLPADSLTFRALAKMAKSYGFHLHDRPAYDCAIISLDTEDPREEDQRQEDQRQEDQRQEVLKSIRRKEQEKRGLKKLSQLGPVRMTYLDPAQLEVGLQLVFSAHIARFLASNRLSPFINPQRRAFISELGKLLGSAGWLNFSQLDVAGEPIAWNFGFRFYDSWFWYLPTFKIEYGGSSPGSCLLRLLTEEACADRSVKRLDLGLGDEAYKERFGNTIRSTRHVQMTTNLLQHMAHASRHLLTSWARRFRVIDKKIRQGRDLSRRLQSRIRKAGTIATTQHVLGTALRSLHSEDELAFFEAEAPEKRITDKSLTLIPLDWEKLSRAAMDNAEDEDTLAYLARAAQRLREGRAKGYMLRDEAGGPFHFLWIADYDGFHIAEIDVNLEPRDAKAAMIFDCWTPPSKRGRGSYSVAIALAAAQLQAQQRPAWIFAAARNQPSLQGITKAGFLHRFSLVRVRSWGKTTISCRAK